MWYSDSLNKRKRIGVIWFHVRSLALNEMDHKLFLLFSSQADNKCRMSAAAAQLSNGRTLLSAHLLQLWVHLAIYSLCIYTHMYIAWISKIFALSGVLQAITLVRYVCWSLALASVTVVTVGNGWLWTACVRKVDGELQNPFEDAA